MEVDEQAWELKWNAVLLKGKGYLVQGRQLASVVAQEPSIISSDHYGHCQEVPQGRVGHGSENAPLSLAVGSSKVHI